MPIARITGQGLAAIAIAVALLWGCLLGERVLRGRAAAEETRVLNDIRLLQRHHAQPVSDPLLRLRRAPRVTAS